MSRRQVLFATLVGAGTAFAGYVAAKIQMTATAPSALSGSPMSALDLRRVKPYDLTRPRVLFVRGDARRGFGGDEQLDVYRLGAADPPVYDCRFDAQGVPIELPSSDAAVLTIGMPFSQALVDVVVAGIDGAVPPLLERLVDQGIASDLAELQAANGTLPAIGQLWVFVPRGAPWTPGDYEVSAHGVSGFTLRFRVGPN